jgi:glycerate 2-kinase
LKNFARSIFDSAVESVLPENLIRNCIKLINNELTILNKKFYLEEYKNIFVIGGGKASGLMALALESILGDRIKKGVVTVKDHPIRKCRFINIIKASHPIPDEKSLYAAVEIEAIAKEAGEEDLVIALISGGASALVSSPVPPITLKNKRVVTNILLKSGANIHEINTIRKHLSGIKGGQLAKKVFPSTLITLFISDVVGDDLSFISSGPTVPDMTSFQDCMNIIEKYNLIDKLPLRVIEHLQEGINGIISETPKPGDPAFIKTHNLLIGNNQLAAKEASKKAKSIGLNPLILTTQMQGEAKEAAKFLVSVAKEVKKNDQPIKKPACIISAGETTVTVSGKGKGGRNQELALSAAIELDGGNGITFLSAGTDGIDGFTDAAGAIVDGETVSRGKDLKLSALQYLRNNDSYNFFSPLDDLVIIGQTFTNVMDLQVIIVENI